MQRATPADGLRWRVLVVVAHLVSWPLLTVAALTASTLFHLQIEAGRGVIATQASVSASELLRGEIAIGRIAVLTPSEITIQDIEVRDPDGALVMTVGNLTAHPDPWSLLVGDIRIEALSIEDPEAWLTERDGELALVSALSPVEPAAEPDPGEPPPRFVLETLRVRRGALRDLPNGHAVDGIELLAAIRADPDLRIDVRRLTAQATREGEPLARLARLEATVAMSPGESSRWALEIGSRGDRLETHGELDWTDDGPGRFSADASAVASPALFERLGLIEVATALATPIDVRAHAEGTAEAFDVEADVGTDGGRARLVGQRRGERAVVTMTTGDLDLGGVLAGVDGAVAGSVRVEVAGLTAEEGNVEVTVENARYDEWSVPLLWARATVGAETVTLHGVEAPHLTEGGGHLNLTGHLGADRSFELQLDTRLPQVAVDANVRRAAPGVRGGVTARLSARASPGAATVDVEGLVEARALRLPGLRAGHIHVDGEFHGPPRCTGRPTRGARLGSGRCRHDDNVTDSDRGGRPSALPGQRRRPVDRRAARYLVSNGFARRAPRPRRRPARRGSLVFSGGATADPTIDLTATHTLEGDDTVTVFMTGRLRQPEIRFATNIPSIESEAEIIQLLVYGRGGSRQTAEGEAAAALGALTAGLLSSLTRRELGHVLPRFAIESRAGQGTRVRAGIQADDLIPGFLRGAVRSAHVEGFVGSSEGAEGAATTTGGVLLELYFPYHLVTSGAFEQPDNWSVDLTWEP